MDRLADPGGWRPHRASHRVRRPRPLPSQALLSGASRERALLRFEGLPVYLVENVGQFHPDVHFFVKGREKSVFFTATGVTVRLCKDEKAHALQFLFEGARTEVRPDGHEQRSTVFSYFRGSDPDEWVRGARAYRAIVVSRSLARHRPVCDTKGSRLKFTYRVHPGADPARNPDPGARGGWCVTVDRKVRFISSRPWANWWTSRPSPTRCQGAGSCR